MKNINSIRLLSFLLLIPILGICQRAGELDRSFNYGRGYNYTFNYGTGPSGPILNSIVQPDGKIIIDGSFSMYNGLKYNQLARINVDGSLDFSFNSNALIANGFIVHSIALLPNNKILVGGRDNYNYRVSIYRLNSNGSIDTGFRTDNNLVQSVGKMTVQPNGKILVSGGSYVSNGRTYNQIYRLNENGTIDPSFYTGTGPNGWVKDVAVLPNNKIIIGGEFTRYNNISKNYLACLNADGSLDQSFGNGTPNGRVNCILAKDNGKLLIGGAFSSYNNIAHNNFVGLNENGSLDTLFNAGAGANDEVTRIFIQPNNKLILIGQFTEFNNIPYLKMARLNESGSIDNTFNVVHSLNQGYLNLASISILNDNKLLVTGNFINFGGTDRKYIVCLNPEGSINLNFNPISGVTSRINAVGLQNDGKIVIGGQFQSYNGIPSNYLQRLHSNGSLDPSFEIGTGPNNVIYDLIIQPDGKVIIAGSFSRFNNSIKIYIARLNVDGSIDQTFNSSLTGWFNDRITAIALQNDGKILIGGNFEFQTTGRPEDLNLARLNSDGSRDTTFRSSFSTSSGISCITVQNDGKILVGGTFSFSSNGNQYVSLIRLNSNGRIDSSFNPGLGINSVIGSVVSLPTNKILVSGDVWFTNNSQRSNVFRLNQNGTIDITYNSRSLGYTDNRNFVMTLQTDGKALIAGNLSQNNTTYRLLRLDSNGNSDNSLAVPGDFSGDVDKIIVQPNNAIILAGSISSIYNFSTPGILRILGEACVPAFGPTINALGPTSFCVGDSVVLSASNSEIYNWSNGAKTQRITVKNSGYYSVRTIQNGCTTLHSNVIEVVSIPTPEVPIISATYTNLIGSNESLVSVVNRFSNVEYEWSNGAVGPSITVNSNDTVSVRARINNCRSAYSAPIIITSTNSKLLPKVISITPNPATDKVTIKTTGTGTLEILNTLGQVVITQPAIGTNEINISKLAKGVYTVRFNGVSQKLVVK
ncbi:MAG: T9SS type A sorting domain-containing protein [Flexibacteraceae bacterium]